jgi:hypothetical protein
MVGGCGGGNAGPQVPAATGTYAGQAIVGTDRVGRIVVQTTSANVAQGALEVTPTVNPTGEQPLTLPEGIYPFSGTRSGNSFTATIGSGSPLAGLTVNGTLTSANTGTFQLSGALNGATYNFTGPLLAGGFVATLSQPASTNVDLSRFNATSTQSNFVNDNGKRRIQVIATVGTGTATRTILFSLFKENAFRVGDTLNLNRYEAGSTVRYSATSGPGAGTWISHDGEARIDAINGNAVTITILNARMEGDPYQLGEFFLNGSGTFYLNRPLS